MYHYVRPSSEEYPNLNTLDIEIFRRQLDYFEKKYGFLSKEEYQNAVKKRINPKGVVLTFDDGFKDHFKYVLPELRKRGLWGIFYVSTGIYSNNELLGVHRIHYLEGKHGSRVILQEVLKYIDNSMLDHNTIGDFDIDIYSTENYQEDEKKLRRLLNYFVSYKYRDRILEKLMIKFFDETKLFSEVYLSINEIQALVLAGNIVGAHTVTHKVLSRLSYQEQLDEIKNSFDFIANIVSQDYKSFCYPYGSSSSFDQNTLKILDELNIDDACVFDNKVQKNEINKYELSRIDCNQFLWV
jgi:peptidoglycan/xylan/chitin deacetylase (PgdA/CDA1 family)